MANLEYTVNLCVESLQLPFVPLSVRTPPWETVFASRLFTHNQMPTKQTKLSIQHRATQQTQPKITHLQTAPLKTALPLKMEGLSISIAATTNRII